MMLGCRRRQKHFIYLLMSFLMLSCVLQLVSEFPLGHTVVEDEMEYQAEPPTESPYFHYPLSFNPLAKTIPWEVAYEIKMGVDENFFKPRDRIITSINPKYILKGETVCNGDVPPYLIVIVPSPPSNTNERDIIRQTWASVSKTQKWPLRIVNAEVKVVFLLGRNVTEQEWKHIDTENEKHQDIVMADFVDSYRNLSYKILTGLSWAKTFCPLAKFILKCDQDTFVNIPLILDFLMIYEKELNNSVIGFVYGKSKVLRSGRWNVEHSAYPLTHYPTYTSGNAYIISRDLAWRMRTLAELMPYVPVEDAYITGILAKTANGRHINSKRFTQLNDKKPDPCDFLYDKRLACTKAKDVDKLDIWNVYESNMC